MRGRVCGAASRRGDGDDEVWDSAGEESWVDWVGAVDCAASGEGFAWVEAEALEGCGCGDCEWREGELYCCGCEGVDGAQPARKLRTERIDVWLLHEVTSDDLRDSDALLRLLEDLVAAGTIGAFGVGSERKKTETLAIKRPKFCGVMQFEWSVMDRPVQGLAGFRIHHRALTDNFRELHAGLVGDKARCAEWSRTVDADLADGAVLASLMLKAALVENPESVILFSSKKPEHIRSNVRDLLVMRRLRPRRRSFTAGAGGGEGAA